MQIKCLKSGILKDILKEQFSKKYTRYLKKQNAKYYINGKEIKNYYSVFKDDIIDIKFESIKNKEEILYDFELDIIYEDDNFMVVNKPCDLNTIPTRLEPQKSLYNAVYTYLNKNNKLKTIHIITRLDRKTSGLVLIALNKETALYLNKNHANIHKIYYARVEGIIDDDNFIIDKPIKKDNDTGKRVISEDGKKSKTEFKVISSSDFTTTLECILYTGRTHQIRVHLSSIGHPIIGDDLYGNGDGILNLECNCLTFTLEDNKEYTFKLPPAVWMKD